MNANINISVVIASGAGGDFLFRCLDGLKKQQRAEKWEIIVVDRVGGETAARIGRDYPDVVLIRTDPVRRLSIPELRRLGVERSSGDIVAIIEEHCVPPADWVSTIERNFKQGDSAIGGPILHDNYDRLRDWVVYFSEYHNYLPPWRSGVRDNLNGANIAYDRKRLIVHKDRLDDGYWEVVVNPVLSREGKFRSVPEMGVRHTGPFDYLYYLNQRYLLSRVWGGTQRHEVGAVKRLVYLLLAPVFPFLLLGRIGSRVLESGQLRGRFLASLPLLVPVMFAYVWGEWLGYLIGPGNALIRVE